MIVGLDWNKWAAIGQLVGAAGTFAAVVLSPYLARRAEKPKLNLSAGIRIIIAQGNEPPYPEVIDLTLRNIGSLTTHISQFGWQTGRWPFSHPRWAIRQYAIQMAGDTGMGTNPPYELPPGQRRTSILDHDQFFDGLQQKRGVFFARNWPMLGLIRTPIWVVAHLESGVLIRERVERDLARALFEAEASKK
ncbi:MAG: hypothetical protein ABIT68_01195 [Sphingomicrobium sp.]